MDDAKLIAALREISTAMPGHVDAGTVWDAADRLEALRAQPVRVKALVWKENSANGIWTGELSFGAFYVAYDVGNGWRCFRGQFLSEAGEDEIAYGTRPAVLAAAQADYERRVLSALEPAPVVITDEMVERAAGQVMSEVREWWRDEHGRTLDALMAKWRRRDESLDRGEWLGVSEIAGRMQIGKSAARRELHRLAELGLVEKCEFNNGTFWRGRFVALTPNGGIGDE